MSDDIIHLSLQYGNATILCQIHMKILFWKEINCLCFHSKKPVMIWWIKKSWMDCLLRILQLLQLINQFMKKQKHKHFSSLFTFLEASGYKIWPLVHTVPSVNTRRQQRRLCYRWLTAIVMSLTSPVCMTLWEDMTIQINYKSFREAEWVLCWM